MSGHSKWSTIKHKKAAMDQKRGAIFSKLSKDISIAVKEGRSGDPVQNPRLRLVLQKAREANMPSDNVKRAIEKGLGASDGSGLEEIIYEGYGNSGVAFVVVTKTDNRQRTTAVLKSLFDRAGGSLGSPGSAMFLFEREEEIYKAKHQMIITDEVKVKVEAFIEELKSQEDVDAVYCNALLIHE